MSLLCGHLPEASLPRVFETLGTSPWNVRINFVPAGGVAGDSSSSQALESVFKSVLVQDQIHLVLPSFYVSSVT